MFHGTGEYISLDLFYFVNLTSSCSLIPLDLPDKGSIAPILRPLFKTHSTPNST